MTNAPYRILAHNPHDAGEPPVVSLTVDGTPLRAYAGEPLAATLLAHGLRVCRTTASDGAARGIFCGIGVCSDCVMEVNGTPGVRTCLIPVQDGMQVETQHGPGAWQFARDDTGSTQ